jgi:hypothetical protein
VNKRLDELLGLSVALTGFDRLHLIGTGVAAEYLDTLDRIVSPVVVDALLKAYALLPADDPDAAALKQRILDDEMLGPLARNLVVLWYTGTWTPLPPDWPAPGVRSHLDVAGVVSPAAYLAGLQWRTVGAHPAGALPTGFASWASPPPGVEA